MSFTKKQIENFRDPHWRLTHLYHIRTKRGTVELFKPNPMQKAYLKEETNKDIVLKARQLGFSTLKLIQLLDRTMFKPNTTSVILAHKKDSVQKLFRIIKMAYDRYPSKYPKPAAKYDNKNELFFEEINSNIYVATDVRGDTITNLHISEMAFMRDAENRYIATKAALIPGGRITVESTANGVGDYFYDFYMQAEERGFKSHFFPWYFAKEYAEPADGVEFSKEDRSYQKRHKLSDEQLAWYVYQKADLKDLMKQEYPSTPMEAFITAGANVFPVEILDQIEVLEPKIKDGEGLLIWQKPIYGHRYVMGVDVANDGLDESSVDILDAETGVQVAHFSGRILVPLFAAKLAHWARMYNNALLTVEVNNHGYALLNILQDERPRLKFYKREKFDALKRKTIKKVGWMTSARTKAIMTQQMNAALYEEDIQILNEKTVQQMRTFLQDQESGKMGATAGKHDDCVMSLCIALQGMKQISRPQQTQPITMDFTGASGGIAY